MDKIELGTPFRTVIIKILSCNPKMLSVFGRTKEKDLFFKDLLTIGCDFYELLELFANCEAINNESINFKNLDNLINNLYIDIYYEDNIDTVKINLFLTYSNDNLLTKKVKSIA